MAGTYHTPADTTADAIAKSLVSSFDSATRDTAPYTYWTARKVLPDAVAGAICQLPFAAPDLGGISGKREKHNATRTYFDRLNREKYDVVDATAQAFQSAAVTSKIEDLFGISLAGSYLRMEYAQDVDGFWLEPHSDLGVKLFTLLLYLSDDPMHIYLGTDIYDEDKNWKASTPFVPNHAMVFVPADDTFHGFERRPIVGVRKSLIVNYVTDEWRAPNCLAFTMSITIVPETPALHAEAIEALYDVTFGPGHFAKTAERLREFNHSLPDLNRVAMLDGHVIGATRMWPVSVAQGGRALFVGPVAVHPSQRGNRLGLTITKAAMDAATEALWPVAILIGAPAYFGQIGFTQIPAGQLQFPGPQNPARIMMAALSGRLENYSGNIRAGYQKPCGQ